MLSLAACGIFFGDGNQESWSEACGGPVVYETLRF